LRAVALPAGPTVRQGHLARVGDGDLLAADAPALWAGVLCLVGVRLNHMRQSIFRGYVPLMRGAPSMGCSLPRPSAPAALSALPLRAESGRELGADGDDCLSSAPKAWDSGDRMLASRPGAEAAPIGRLTLRR
jgi:hypothetical protein